MTAHMLTVTVSGSFQRHLEDVQKAVDALTGCGALVLSPANPQIVDSLDGFVFVASDERRTIKGVQNRHLAAIGRSAFLWLVCPDGYVGTSAAFEVGYAVSMDIPVYATVPPNDVTLVEYVEIVDTVAQACAKAAASAPAANGPGVVLLDPEATILALHDDVDILDSQLHDPGEHRNDPAAVTVARLQDRLRYPTQETT